MNRLKKFLDTSDYQFYKTEFTGLAGVVDFMSVIHKIGFEKHPKIKDGLKRVWNSNFAQSIDEKIKITKNAKSN